MVYFKNLKWRCTGVNIAVISVESPINDTMKKYIIFNEIAKSFRTSFLQNTSLVASYLILVAFKFLKFFVKILKSTQVASSLWPLQFAKFKIWQIWQTYEHVLHGSSWTHCSFVFIHWRPVFHSYGN